MALRQNWRKFRDLSCRIGGGTDLATTGLDRGRAAFGTGYATHSAKQAAGGTKSCTAPCAELAALIHSILDTTRRTDTAASGQPLDSDIIHIRGGIMLSFLQHYEWRFLHATTKAKGLRRLGAIRRTWPLNSAALESEDQVALGTSSGASRIAISRPPSLPYCRIHAQLCPVSTTESCGDVGVEVGWLRRRSRAEFLQLPCKAWSRDFEVPYSLVWPIYAPTDVRRDFSIGCISFMHASAASTILLGDRYCAIRRMAGLAHSFSRVISPVCPHLSTLSPWSRMHVCVHHVEGFEPVHIV